MALTDGMGAADVAAIMNSNGRNWGDNGAWWILILFLFAFGGGNWGGNNNGNALAADMQRGFDQTQTQGALAGLQAQIGNGFSDAAVARCNASTNLLQAMNANQMAITQGMNTLAMSLQQCCCDNRANIADLKYTVATENCQDRQALSDGLRDLMAQNTLNTQAIINSQNQGFQGIQDKLCALEIDNLKQANEQLRTQLNMAALAASQTAQTAAIVDALKPATTTA